MTKKDLIQKLSEETGITQSDVGVFLSALANIGESELKKVGEFALPGFGKFSTKYHAPRAGRNPMTGEAVDIEAQTRIKFSVTKTLKDAVNQ